MIVITLTNCPISLRGDLTKWLLEINTGVFVGRVSARVRDNLWKRVCENVKQGQATLVYNTNNEQHMDFRIHQSENEIIDFDGLKLVMKPSPARASRLSKARMGFSKVSKIRMAKAKSKAGKPKQDAQASERQSLDNSSTYPSDYTIVDLETTGLNCCEDYVIEVGLLRVRNNAVVGKFNALIAVEEQLKPFIVQMTGITDKLLAEEGEAIGDVLMDGFNFVGDDVLVGHNISFDMGFLEEEAKRCGLNILHNKTLDTVEMFTRVLNGEKASKKLVDIAKRYGIDCVVRHRSLADCNLLKQVYDSMLVELKTK